MHRRDRIERRNLRAASTACYGHGRQGLPSDQCDRMERGGAEGQHTIRVLEENGTLIGDRSRDFPVAHGVDLRERDRPIELAEAKHLRIPPR